MTEVKRKTQKRCPNCGMTLERFKKTGLLGCAECYKVFREEAAAAALCVQGKLQHVSETVSEAEKREGLELQKKVLEERIRQAMNEGKESEIQEIETEIDKIEKELCWWGEEA